MSGAGSIAALPRCPEGRLSSPVTERDGVTVLDLDTYVPHLLGAVNNPLSAGASALYLERFGVGVVEWRVLSTLRIEPAIPASRIAAVFAGDKAAVSRALKRLLADGHVTFRAMPSDPRRRTWTLTATGERLHGEIMALALAREAQLIAGADPHDLEAFLRVMRLMRRNVARLRPEAPAQTQTSPE